MRLSPKTIMTAVTATAITVALPVTVALSKVDPQENAVQRSSAFAEAGRPMDNISGEPFAQGDLSIFDDIQQIGMDQSVDVPYCDRRAKLLNTLDHDFAEKPLAHQSLKSDRSVELWASDLMGTWTAVYTRADGISCVVSSGIGWERDDSPIARLETEGLLPTG
ncbi:hypothetical protein BFP70_09595 [Thioclava sp. SK-1]|uniref:hypothetical protein n=1 Tax=Thioclava sp. SK-1 TaxID=1889770 RepID=UPI000826BFBF|nr:hypothetical protein [Thioclava sp. SK-1]OCX65312.1 hypothetical protein BFP70_09595 [Thioclava sp. SK-1]